MDELGINDPFEALDPAKDPIGQAIKEKQEATSTCSYWIGSNILDSSPWISGSCNQSKPRHFYPDQS